MNNERMWSVEERARKHAALADPVRLRMLDLLTLGDLSPTELRTEVGVPSNLLAHHLNLLEREGIIARDRSEGDKRRTYVRLVPGALTGLGLFADVDAAADRVVFVCSANSARSQLAEALWNTVSPVPAQSAGTHPADRVAPGAIATAARHGLDLTGAVPRLVDGIDMEGAFIVTVCDRAHEEYPGGTAHWSVPDPVRTGTDAAFESAFADLRRRIDQLAPRIHR
ncbi:MAG: ArsR family transcriptional regulator [Microbacterium sp. SCN 70-27]|uniref:arsenate reductase/protein-tyrosine-phosphatase family protein n=1 Tax=unclassified Microbacterium TaxID=2609290 RepID=UPI00086C9923|nr:MULTISPECIES: helix-turn-helix domain-containing protein [unclassified Microbacterium]MBN9224373.1 helix-turn-helix domain-containing protein [Microbacterium sp.]ODT27294.1 MAG: ArsR family transcriptional regulator [Microbacterium sp. SCN 70-27]